MPAWRHPAVVAIVCAALAAGGCGDGEDRPNQVSSDAPGTTATTGAGGQGTGAGKPAFSQAEADTAVQVQLRDFGFFGIPDRVRGPKVFFTASNAGPAVHELEISDAGGRVVAGIEPFAAGRTETLAAELQPGTYTVQCLVAEGGRTHVEFGMVTELTVE